MRFLAFETTLKAWYSQANFLASEGLQRLIHDKEELTSEWQSKQEVVTLSQEVAPLRAQFEETKAKWVEVHNVVLAASDREDATAERLNNLEASLNSKTEEVTVAEAKHARLEEKHNRTIEHNRVFSSIVRELDVSLRSTRSTRDNLSAEVDRLKEELQHRASSLIVEKTYAMYSMSRKNLEKAKAGVIDFDAEIAKARELESIAKRGLPVRPDATDSSGPSSEFSGTVEQAKGDNAEGQNIEPAADLPTSPGGADASLPPSFEDTVS
ncbi:PREDICTED: uncharacterized protein LOC109229994 [Nicotiana attenuata]|uniref:uncharacterized protein LOC109229994 n=1 Tax=Nicotiana attenuata TaxID=49451 RepID=UPI0009053663|nr:PREDICTED: uncharacterized protein LOC109229994 [Nicotiana attenuata]